MWSELPKNLRKRHVRDTHEKRNYLRYNHLRSAELKLLLNNTHNKSEQHVLLLNHALRSMEDNLTFNPKEANVPTSGTFTRSKRHVEGTTDRAQELIHLAPLAAPVISTFMSSLIRPMATAIMNRRSSSDGHKHRIINNFIPAAIRATKMAGTQTANNIKLVH